MRTFWLSLALITVIGGVPDAQTRATAGSARLTGTVVAAATGEPLAGADVRILETNTRTFSAPDGHFEFDNLPAGEHTVVASRAGYITSAAGMSGPKDRPLPIELKAGSGRHVEIRLSALGAITGRVVNEAGQPASGVHVRAVRQRATPSPSNQDGAEVSLDDDGRFSLRGLDPGRYFVVADKRGTRTGRRAGSAGSIARDGDQLASLTYYPGTAFPDQAVAIEIAAGEDTDASFTLASTRHATITGVVLDARGEPARDYMLLATASLTPQPRNPVSIGVRIDGGRFEVVGVPPGEYVVEATTQQIGISALTGIPQVSSSATAERARGTVRVSGDDVTGLMLRLNAGFTVSGRIVDHAGTPIALSGLPLSATPVEERTRQTLALTLADGTFSFQRLHGRHVIRLQQPAQRVALAVTRVQANGVDIGDEGVDVVADTSIDVVLGTATQLSGFVRTRSGRAIPGAWVIIFAESPASWTMPDSNRRQYVRASNTGEFQIVGLPPGRYYAAVPDGILADDSATQTPFVDDFSTLVPGATVFSLTSGETKSLTISVD